MCQAHRPKAGSGFAAAAAADDALSQCKITIKVLLPL